MLDPVEPAEVLPDAARAPVEVPLEASRQPVCHVCGKFLRGRQQICSGKCRAAQSRDKKAQAEAERTRQIRALLTEALRLLDGGTTAAGTAR